jgi:hypothetical protein
LLQRHPTIASPGKLDRYLRMKRIAGSQWQQTDLKRSS